MQAGSVVTNGYLLPEKTARRLKRAGIADAQEWKQKVEIEKLQTRIEALEVRVKKMG
jgi:hypothetical protein